MADKYLDKINYHTQTLKILVDQINCLSDALILCGNKDLAKKLEKTAALISESEKGINETISDEIFKRFDHSDDSLKGYLDAIKQTPESEKTGTHE